MNAVDLSEFQQFSNEKMKKNNVFQTPRFFCDIYCFEPGQEQKGHTHGEQDKVYLVLEGQGTFQVGSAKQVLGPGQGTMAHRVHQPCRQALRTDAGCLRSPISEFEERRPDDLSALQ